MQIDTSSTQSTVHACTDFVNRLKKRKKHLQKWAKRTNVSSYRLYDKDIPEIPLAIDIYQSDETFLHIALYERPYQKDEAEEATWLCEMAKASANALEIPLQNVRTKMRKKQRGEDAQYTKLDNSKNRIVIQEQGLKFWVNLNDYLDTGLFFDHRPLRKTVMDTCKDKDVLNLFCYTGSFSCYAAKGGAKSVTSVDLSRQYLDWAKDNFLLNEINLAKKTESGQIAYKFLQDDCVAFVQNAACAQKMHFDIIILDPPTFSNSKKLKNDFSVDKQWQNLVNDCIKLLKPNGVLYFSTNSRKLKFDKNLVAGTVDDITASTIPEDFRNKHIHRCWRITANNVFY